MSDLTAAIASNNVQAPQDKTRTSGQGENVASNFHALLEAERQVSNDTHRALSLKAVTEVSRSLNPERDERINAMRQLHEQTYPLHQKIGEAFNQLRKLFSDAGMELVDMIQISKNPAGGFVINGWGKGESVSHPQGKFLNAVFNGQESSFSEVSDKISALINKIEGWHSQIQDLQQENAELLSEPFERKASIFDDNVVLGVEHPARINGAARELAREKPEVFKAFNASLAGELEKLTSEQVLSRFYFDTVGKQSLPEELLKFFA